MTRPYEGEGFGILYVVVSKSVMLKFFCGFIVWNHVFVFSNLSLRIFKSSALQLKNVNWSEKTQVNSEKKPFAHSFWWIKNHWKSSVVINSECKLPAVWSVDNLMHGMWGIWFLSQVRKDICSWMIFLHGCQSRANDR